MAKSKVDLEPKDFADFFQKFFDEAFKKIAVNENHRLESSRKLKNILDGTDEIDDILTKLTQ